MEGGAGGVLASASRIRQPGPVNGITMEVNQLKRQLKDLGERIASLRGFL
jgi:hypothetical protein